MKILFALMAFAMVNASVANAQETKEKTVIIISDNDGKQNLSTVEVKGDKVFIDGREIDNKSENLSSNDSSLKTVRIIKRKSDLNLRPSMGILFEKKNNDLVITNVIEQSGAAKAGLKKGDVITSVDGKKVNSPEDLRSLVGGKNNGDKVEVKYNRDGKNLRTMVEVTVMLEKKLLNEGFDLNGMFNSPDVLMNLDKLSLNGDLLNFDKPKLGLKLKDIEGKDGVQVIEVTKDALGDKSGFKLNDIITHVNGNKVSNTTRLEMALALAFLKKTVEFDIERDGKAAKVTVAYPKDIKTVDI